MSTRQSPFTLAAMMDRAIAECVREGRASPANPLVCPLNRAWSPGKREVAQRWLDQAAEHLAVRP